MESLTCTAAETGALTKVGAGAGAAEMLGREGGVAGAIFVSLFLD